VNGKGDKPRSGADQEAFRANWASIFSNDELLSACCTAPMDEDYKICTKCFEHCEPRTEDDE
jgi:hypothetical protein